MSAHASPAPDGPGVLVLGAGAAGLSAAWFLRERGIRRITVLEREERVGGRCRSVVVGDRLLEMGAIAVFPCYRNVRGFIRRFGLVTEPLGPYHLKDADSGQCVPLTRIRQDAGTVRFFAAVARFHYERARAAPFVDAPLGFRALPAELCDPFASWLRARRLEALAPLFQVPVASFGYGFLDEIPAAFALRYMRPAMLNDFLAYGLLPTKRIEWLSRSGYQGLLQAMADDLVEGGGRLLTGQSAARIEREDGVVLHRPGTPPERYDALLVTVPDAAALEATLRLEPAEREVFSRVRFRNYATALARVEGVDVGGLCWAEGPLVQLFRPRADDELAILYCYDRDGSVSLDAMLAGAEETLRSRGARLVEVVEARAWRYFPHFDSEALREGWADRLGALHRNSRRTWYAGGLLAFDTVEEVMEVSRHVAADMAARLSPAATPGTR